jgi:hypothetical protein
VRSAAEQLAFACALAAVLLGTARAAAHDGQNEDLVMAEPAPEPRAAAVPGTQAHFEVSAPRCPESERRRHPMGRCPSTRDQLDIVTIFGLRATLTRVQGSDAVAGAVLGGAGVAYDTRDLATIRLTHFAFLGGGTGGVEGGIGLAYAMGLLAPLGSNHGPFARLGGRAQVYGNDELYTSLVELPELQLGYQLLERDLHFELAGRGGAVLVGRYNPANASRPLGKAFEWGGIASLRVNAVHLDVEFMRIEARSSAPETPVDVLSAMLCGAVFPLGICLDMRRHSGEVRPRSGGPSLDLESTYVGLTVGAGNEL